MKLKNILFLVFIVGMGPSAFCQATAVTVPTEAPRPAPVTEADFRNVAPPMTDRQVADLARFQSETVSRILGVEMRVDGVIPRALRTRHPLQLINPFAPPEYGNGLDNVVINPQTGQAEGIRFLGVKF